jgi:hypothetical protein
MQVEDAARITVRVLGLVLLGSGAAGLFEWLARPDVFACLDALPREFDDLRGVLAPLKGHVDAWSLADGVLRSVMAGLGLYMLLGGTLIVRILCRGLPNERTA